MDQNLLTTSDLSAGNNLDGEYEFLKALGLIEDDDEVKIGDDEVKIGDDEVKIGDDDANDEFGRGDDTNVDDEIWTVDDDTEEEDDDDEWWDLSKPYTGWDYIAHFGEDAWDIVYQARLARHRNILLRLFTRCLSNLSEQVRNELFDAFSISKEFGVEEHNLLLDALAHPKKGLSLSKYDELGLY